MAEMFVGLKVLYLILVIAMVVVIIAMLMDLIFGWRKAKMRGEARTSYAFSRTITKFALYEGVMIIAGGMDTLIHFVWNMFLPDMLYSVPCIAVLIAITLCSVEIWSMKENAEEKTKRNLSQVINFAEKHLSKEQVISILADAIRKAGDKDGEAAL